MFARLIEALFKDRDGYVGRKLTAAWALTLLTSLLLVIHVPATLILKPEEPLTQFLNSGDYAATISIIWATYFAATSANQWVYRITKKKTDEESDGESN